MKRAYNRCHTCDKKYTNIGHTRIGPAGLWCFCYCSDKCAENIESESVEMWTRLRAAAEFLPRNPPPITLTDKSLK